MAPHMLRFEIWKDAASNSHEMSRVMPDGDRLRQAVSPAAILVHTFDARSDFDAFRKNHDWHGYGVWKAPAGLTERAFTEAEAIAQRDYLVTRAVD